MTLIWTRRLSFTCERLAQSSTQRIRVRNPADISIGFAVEPVAPESGFAVAPSEGFIAAGDEANVEVTFTPLEMRTHAAVVRLRANVLGGREMECKLTGSVRFSGAGRVPSLPGATTERRVRGAQPRPSGCDAQPHRAAQDDSALQPASRGRSPSKVRAPAAAAAQSCLPWSQLRALKLRSGRCTDNRSHRAAAGREDSAGARRG